MKLCTEFERNRAIRGRVSLLRFQYLTQWPWTCVPCCTRLWDNFFSPSNRPSTK